MRKLKKGIAVLASTVLMVTSAVNYQGFTLSTNVYSEETSNAETVSEVESVQPETQAAVQAETVPIETVAVQAETEAIVQSKATEAELISEATQESRTASTSEIATESTEPTELAEVTSFEETSESAKSEETTALAESETEETKQEVASEAEEAESTEIESLEETSEEETETSEAESEEAETEDGFAAMSLLPLEEIEAYLHLEDKTEEAIKKLSIDEVLNSLVDKDGNKIAIRPENATTAWYKDRSGYVEQYVEYPLGQNKEINLFKEYTSEYRIELIVGSKKQLDMGNKRYLITVNLEKKISEIALNDVISYQLFFQNESGEREEVASDNIVISRKMFTDYNTDIFYNNIDTVLSHDPNYWSGKEYYLGICSNAAEEYGVDVDVYTYEEYVKLQKGLDAKPCTDQILNQDMMQKDRGRKGTYEDDPSNETSRIFWVRYKNSKGEEYYIAVEFAVASDVSSSQNWIYSYDGAHMVEVLDYKPAKQVKRNVSAVNSATGKEENFDCIEYESFRLKKGYSESDAYYFGMDMQGGQRGIVKAVEGLYKSLEEAASQPDIKEQLIPISASQTPRGYKSNYSEPKYFTIFGKNNSVLNIQVEVTEYQTSDNKKYTEAPIIGQPDDWFWVNSIKTNDGHRTSVILENSYSMNLYTMYGYGYQTVLIQDEMVDLSQLCPIWTVNEDHVTKVTVNGKEVQSGQVIDCSRENPDDPKSESNPESTKGTVHFTVTVDEHPKEYYVTFVKATSGKDKQKLFVAGPRKQEVFLNEYTEYKHDILIANLGKEELTGLRVELNATNCKLDDYWTVGGENNNTLAAFDSVDTGWHSVLGNVAKVRLVPSNAEGGKIEGTLTVYADGQEPIVIELLGYAQNPRLVTNQETFSKVAAVKYVPYSYMFSTNNMYDWVDVSYELEGNLPAGIKWYPKTGEIYGTPTETGTFKFKITANFTSEASYGFSPSSVELTLTVDDNTAENVYKASSDGYSIKQALGTDMGDYKYVVTSLEDAEFISNGVFTEFDNEYCDVWLNGKKLTRGEDYDAESGSTRITIHGETFENTDYVNQDGENTIAIEFRKDGKREEELKRTSQNFTIDLTKPTEPETTEETTTAAPTKPTVEPTKPTTAPTKPTTEESTTAKATTAEESTKEESTTAKHSEASTTSEPTTRTKTEETKKEEAKSTVASTQTPETAATAKENETSASTDQTIAASVKCTVKMVDAENKAIDNLNLELHSTPQKALTDENGCAAFDSIEFGSHTLSVKNTDGTTEGSISFTIAQGNQLSLSGNVITAPSGSDFMMIVRYDQNKLELVSVHDNTVRSSEVILGIEDYAEWIGAFLFGIGIAMAMCLCAYAISSAARRHK